MVATYLLSNILFPTDEEKLNGMTCSELNQFTRGVEFKVSTLLVHLLFSSLYTITELPCKHVIGVLAKLG